MKHKKSAQVIRSSWNRPYPSRATRYWIELPPTRVATLAGLPGLA